MPHEGDRLVIWCLQLSSNRSQFSLPPGTAQFHSPPVAFMNVFRNCSCSSYIEWDRCWSMSPCYSGAGWPGHGAFVASTTSAKKDRAIIKIFGAVHAIIPTLLVSLAKVSMRGILYSVEWKLRPRPYFFKSYIADVAEPVYLLSTNKYSIANRACRAILAEKKTSYSVALSSLTVKKSWKRFHLNKEMRAPRHQPE